MAATPLSTNTNNNTPPEPDKDNMTITTTATIKNKNYYTEISQKIKPITYDQASKDFDDLKSFSKPVNARCRIGNNIVDYFTFEERLHTRGKYNVNYYEFIEQIDTFTKKKFIQNMLIYYDSVKNKNKTKNQHVVWKEVYNICISAINIFRPLVAMEIYKKYKPTCVLDFCMGWGGRCIGAAALNVPKYIGIEINHALESSYQQITDFLETRSETQFHLYFQDALTINFAELPAYDMVFTSPPYYFLEKYSNNTLYENKTKMNRDFYTPLFLRAWENLQPGGYFVLNVNKEIYETVCIGILGVASEIIPLKKSKRQNQYEENIYTFSKEIVL